VPDRQKGGTKRSPLLDFYIGDHAAIADMMLLIRNLNRDRTYLLALKLMAPEY
jgi:hypothetical protein